MNQGSYFSIHASQITKGQGPLQFDVYVRVGNDRFAKVFKRGSEIDRTRLAHYSKTTGDKFFVPIIERGLFLDDAIKQVYGLRQTNQFHTADAKIVIDELAEHTLQEVFTRKSFEPNMQRAMGCLSESYVDLAAKHIQALPEILRLAKKHEYIFKHTITTSIFATLLARSIDPRDRNFVLTCSYAGLVHDIGMCLLQERYDEFSPSLDIHQSVELRRHPGLGVRLLDQNSAVTNDVRIAVFQHHEAMDGSGYPRGLTGDSITIPARVVRIADEFTGMVGGSEGRFALPPSVAIDALMQSKKVDAKLVRVLAKLLKILV